MTSKEFKEWAEKSYEDVQPDISQNERKKIAAKLKEGNYPDRYSGSIAKLF